MNVGIGLSVSNFSSVPTVGLNPDDLIAALFDAGGGTFYEGAWYDPSDLATLYQDAAGTTPVTGTGQPVGLMLDKSKGLTLGSEVVTNGTFDTDTDWTKGTGWTISGGEANAANITSIDYLRQDISVAAGTHEISFTVTSHTAGNLKLYFGVAFVNFPTIGTGTYTAKVYYAGGATSVRLSSYNVNFTGTIDNVSIKELPGNHATQSTSTARPTLQVTGTTPATLGSELVTNGTFDTDTIWGKGSAWSITGGVASCDGSQTDSNQSVFQNTSIVAGNIYKATYTVSNYSAGQVRVRVGSGGTGTYRSANGTYTEYIIAATNTFVYVQGDVNFVGSIDNITVKEVLTWADPKYYLDFDGVDDKILAGSTSTFNFMHDGTGGQCSVALRPSQTLDPNDYYLIAYNNGVSTSQTGFAVRLEDRVSVLNDAWMYQVTRGTVGTAIFSVGAPDTAQSITSESVISFGYNETETPKYFFDQNGVNVYNGNPTTTPSAGNASNIMSLCDQSPQHLYGFVMISRTLGAIEKSSLESYLATKSGVTLP